MKRWLVVRVSVAFTSRLLVGRRDLPRGGTYLDGSEDLSS
jgi:hypothetical protein